MDAMLTMTIELEAARHKRELAESFATLRAELTPPPIRIGDPAWNAMQRALNAAWSERLAGMQAMRPMSPEESAQRAHSPYWNSYLASQQQSPFISDPLGGAAASGMNWLLGWR